MKLPEIPYESGQLVFASLHRMMIIVICWFYHVDVSARIYLLTMIKSHELAIQQTAEPWWISDHLSTTWSFSPSRKKQSWRSIWDREKIHLLKHHGLVCGFLGLWWNSMRNPLNFMMTNTSLYVRSMYIYIYIYMSFQFSTYVLKWKMQRAQHPNKHHLKIGEVSIKWFILVLNQWILTPKRLQTTWFW